jgi:hypothetical protein
VQHRAPPIRGDGHVLRFLQLDKPGEIVPRTILNEVERLQGGRGGHAQPEAILILRCLEAPDAASQSIRASRSWKMHRT